MTSQNWVSVVQDWSSAFYNKFWDVFNIPIKIHIIHLVPFELLKSHVTEQYLLTVGGNNVIIWNRDMLLPCHLLPIGYHLLENCKPLVWEVARIDPSSLSNKMTEMENSMSDQSISWFGESIAILDHVLLTILQIKWLWSLISLPLCIRQLHMTVDLQIWPQLKRTPPVCSKFISSKSLVIII